MKKVMTILFGTLGSLTQAWGAEDCKAKFLNQSHLEYAYKDRQISVFGWTHNLNSDSKDYLSALTRASEATRTSKCNEAKDILTKYLDASETRLKESKRILLSLEILYSKKPFKALGIESSPEEWNEMFDTKTNEHRMARLMNSMNEKCPNLKKLNDDLLKIADPAFYFTSMNSGNIKIRPLESMALKVASTKNLSEETLNFDPDKEVLTPKAKALIEAIQTNIKKGRAPTDDEVNAVVAAEIDSTQKQKIQRVFAELKQIFGLVDQRNAFIANKAVDEEKDIAIVIGNAHVTGLADQLEKLCSQKKALQPPPPRPKSRGLQ